MYILHTMSNTILEFYGTFTAIYSYIIYSTILCILVIVPAIIAIYCYIFFFG